MNDTPVARLVRRLPAGTEPPGPDEAAPVPIETLRDLPAWVLLGEPGAGKSAVFANEAEATGATCLSVSEFVHGLGPPAGSDATLYLDGLDEARASMGDQAIAMGVRRQLLTQGRPRFRISCRAADWLGDADARQLAAVSPNGKLPVYVLLELSDQDVQAIVGDAALANTMQAEARQSGQDAMLRNPQALKMWCRARPAQGAPTRVALYEHHVQMLAEESNLVHRQRGREHGMTMAAKLQAAGQLCATLLLADLDGLSLGGGLADARHPDLDVLPLTDMRAALGAAQSGLFRPGRMPGRLWPVHRSVAEFLGARWLAQRIDAQPLLLPRMLNLMLGGDGRPVAGLRGLYAWLATLSHRAREQLIQADPMTVAVYGEPAAMPPHVKLVLMAQLLAHHAELAHTFGGRHGGLPWGALWDELLNDMVEGCLRDAQRDEHAQRQVWMCVNVLGAARPRDPARWAAQLWALVRDPSRWQGVRVRAARAALHLQPAGSEARSVLGPLMSGELPDEDDELLGLLLRHLYPAQLSLDELMPHLHAPKKPKLIGTYRMFWSSELVDRVPEADLPALVARLLQQRQLLKQEWGGLRTGRLAHQVLARALHNWGDRVDDDTLYRWLPLVLDEDDDHWRRGQDDQAVGDWFGARPDRHKAMLQRIHQACVEAENFRLALYRLSPMVAAWPVPDDLGAWYLAQVDATVNTELQEHCFSQAAACLLRGQGAQGLSIDTLVQWAEASPIHEALWRHWHVNDIPDWKRREQDRQAQRASQREQDKAARTAQVMPQLAAVRLGEASAAWMHRLAMVWRGYFSDIAGDAPRARFEAFADHGEALYEAARAGLRRCLHRPDLPQLRELTALHVQARQHLLTLPCLTGAEIAWADDPAFADDWPTEAVTRLAAMALLQPIHGATQDWYRHMAVLKPQAVADALVACAEAAWRTHASVPGLHELQASEPYGELASMALPALLAAFPLRAKAQHMPHLQLLLQAAARHVPQQLLAQCEARLSRKSLDVTQRLHWLSAAALLQPSQHEQHLLSALGNSQKRAHEVAKLLTHWPSDTLADGRWRPTLLGRLIEVLAPHAELSWASGLVSPAMALGDSLRAMVDQIAQTGTEEAVHELTRLASQPALHEMHGLLRDAALQAQVSWREQAYRYPSLAEVGQALNDGPPGRAADLLALAEAALTHLANEVRNANTNLYRLFWTLPAENSPRAHRRHRDENECRNFIVDQLRHRLNRYRVDAQPEAAYAEEKRADIRLSFGVDFDLPIEIKGEWHREVWSGLTGQLDRFYTRGRSDGHGLYLVLWTGEQSLPLSPDGLPRPQTPAALRERLQAQMTPEQRRRIAVMVMDVSWP